MKFKDATMEDYDVAFDYIVKLWTYNTYDKDEIREVYREVLADENSFAFFLMDDDGRYHESRFSQARASQSSYGCGRVGDGFSWIRYR